MMIHAPGYMGLRSRAPSAPPRLYAPGHMGLLASAGSESVLIEHVRWHSMAGPLDVTITETTTGFRADALIPGTSMRVTAEVSKEALRELMTRAQAWARDGVLVGDEEDVSGIFDDIGKFAKKVLGSKTFKAIGKIVKSPIFAGAMTLVPGIGPILGPTIATVSAAAHLVDGINSGSKKARKKFARIKAQAKRGVPAAKAALGAMRAVNQAKKRGLHSADAIHLLPPSTQHWIEQAAAEAPQQDNNPDAWAAGPVDGDAAIAWPGYGGNMPPDFDDDGSSGVGYEAPGHAIPCLARVDHCVGFAPRRAPIGLLPASRAY